jgi:hypothetical protein
MQGYLLPFLRLLEPEFFSTIKNNLFKNNTELKTQTNQELSVAFLASRLNVELVNSILKGITRFAFVDLQDAQLFDDQK